MQVFLNDGVLGVYNKAKQKTYFDYGKLFWKGYESTFYHEETHHRLTTETNHGIFTGLFAELFEQKLFTKLTEKESKYLLKELAKAEKYVQEAFATLFSLLIIDKKEGRIAALNKLRSLPNEPYGSAYATIDFLLDWEQDKREKFTSKISMCAMNTALPSSFCKPEHFRDEQFIVDFFSNPENHPFKRLQKLASVIIKNPSVLELEPKEICAKVGISFNPGLDDHALASMTNTMLELTDIEKRFTEEEIKANRKTNRTEQFLENVTIMNLNINLEESQHAFGLEDFKTKNRPHLATAFVFYEQNHSIDIKFIPEEAKNKETSAIFFYPNGDKISCLLDVEELKELGLGSDPHITIVCDYHILDGQNIKPGYEFLNPDFIIYRTFSELRTLLNLIKDRELEFYHVSVAPTQGHDFITHFFRLKGQKTIHLFTGLKAHIGLVKTLLPYRKLRRKGGLMKLIKTGNSHFTKVMKFLLGTDTRMDWYEFARNPYSYYPLLHRKVTGVPFLGSI